MPIYEFKCSSCNKKFEELVPMDKRDAVRCPDCGKEVERVYEGACVFSTTNCKGSSACSGSCANCAGCHH